MLYRKGRLKYIFAMLFVLFFLCSFAFNGVYSQVRYSQRDDLPEGIVEILVLMKEQADTRVAVSEALEKDDLDAGSEEGKQVARRAVFDALRETASKSQFSLHSSLKSKGLDKQIEEIKSFFIVNLIYARVPQDLVQIIADLPEVDSVWPNERFYLIEPIDKQEALQGSGVEWNIRRIGVADVWDNLGVDGTGVVVGIIDSGVDWQHETLKAKYRGYNPSAPNNPDHAYNWFDPWYNYDYPNDWIGHGTHVTGTVLGADPAGDNQIGVAPGAQWIAARVFDDKTGFTTEDLLLSSMEFMLAPTPNIDGSGMPDPSKAPDIVNNSWGVTVGCEPIFKRAIQNWRNAEIFPVFAAGNAGSDVVLIPYQISLPANYVESFAVGAIDGQDNLAWFSSRGPGACGDFIKPDISAPGVNIRSALSWNPWRSRGYQIGQGTSMAAPHIAGVAALLLSADSSLTVSELEEIIIDTAEPLVSDSFPEYPNYGFGYGLVDAYASVLSVISPWIWPFP